MKLAYAAGCFGVLLIGSSAVAGSLENKKMWDSADQALATAAGDYKTACGAPINATIDKASYGDAADQTKTARWCDSAVSGAAQGCKDKDYKAALTKQVQNLTCHYDANVKGDDAHNVKVDNQGDTLNVTYNKDSSNISEKVGAFLKSHL